MSEIEELQARIQELEAENQKLKNTLPKEKQDKRALCPKKIAEKHGGLMKGGIAWEYNHFPYMHHIDLTNLSVIIRRCCFQRVRRGKSDYGITLKEMNDEEYVRYSTILDKLLDVFQEYGWMHNDNY